MKQKESCLLISQPKMEKNRKKMKLYLIDVMHDAILTQWDPILSSSCSQCIRPKWET